MFEFTTAIVIVMPHEVQAVAAPIVRQYAPETLIRVRPHITLLFPFVPYDQLETACKTLRDVAQQIAPFTVTLDGYGEFPGVIYMKPADPAPIQAVFRQLYAAFPEYPPYEGQFGDDLQPHMSIAHFESAADQAAVSLPNYRPITFHVDRLHLWYGVSDPDLAWLTYDVIRLRG